MISFYAIHPDIVEVNNVPVKKMRKIENFDDKCTVKELKQLITDRRGKIRAGSRKEDLLNQAKIYTQKDPLQVCSKMLHKNYIKS